ncbi:MAG: SGNH/GDSL hydrolase family protein [Candidatus Kerfeldbacteria bacterium]|nr:SGNH/GDSL hydrolase family protein [Candidatus Kerfeldbacteria bacterium]
MRYHEVDEQPMWFYLPIIGILVILKGRFVAQFLFFLWKVRTGRGLARSSQAFQQLRPDGRLRILLIGDSTVFGTGADDPSATIAGCFGRDFPEAHIRNLGVNGGKVAGLAGQLAQVRDEQYDLIVVLVGGNDVIRNTPLEAVARDIRTALMMARQIGRQVVLLSQGNIGNAPIFPWPLYHIYTRRARRLRDMFMTVANEQNVRFVDLFLERDADPWRRDPNRYYSADHFHPNGTGYGEWYEKIKERLTFNK